MEVHLAEKLQISRTPIREAVRMLEKDGLISRDSMGAFISPLSKKEAMDLYMVRIELEELGVRLAMENGTPEEFEELKNIINYLKNMSLEEETATVIEINTKFHSHLAKMSHNFYLQHTLKDIRTRLQLIRASALVAAKRHEVSVKQHIEIGRAMISGDKETALKVVRKHSEDAASYAISHIYK